MPRLSGTHAVQKFIVGHGQTFALDASLDVQATGDIMIFGRLVSDAGTPPGSGVRLRSSGGNILIAGEITAAAGLAGDSPPPSTSVVAGNGLQGGSIEIASATGYVLILRDAVLTSGVGGPGGDAVAVGTGAAHTLVKAVSGAGGAGGPLSVSAGDFMILEGALVGGPGGYAGNATATGQPPAAPPPLVGNTHAPAPPNEGTVVRRNYPAVVEATGRSGGPGGDVTLATTIKDGKVLLSGRIRGGNGGNCGLAVARGGRRSTAQLETASRGGNIAISLVESALALQNRAQSDIAAGNGGDCGDTSTIGLPPADPNDPPVFWVDGAIADATDTALAWIGSPEERGKPAGGAAGTVTASAVWSPPPNEIRDPIAINVTLAEGGDSTNAVATVGTQRKHEWGIDNIGVVPGGVVKAELP